MERFNKFLYGLIPGLLMPVLFLWIYVNHYFQGDSSFFEILARIYPGAMLGRLLMLSIIPNMVIVFVFYKTDSFKIATGIIVGAIPYLIGSIMMM